MSKLKQAGIGAAFAAGLVLGGGSVAMMTSTKKAPPPAVEPSALYAAADCKADLDAAPSKDCSPCERMFGDDTEPTHTWCCGDAVMGTAVKACLDAAADRVAAAAEEPVGP